MQSELALTAPAAQAEGHRPHLIAACAEDAGEDVVLWHRDADLAAICDPHWTADTSSRGGTLRAPTGTGARDRHSVVLRGTTAALDLGTASLLRQPPLPGRCGGRGRDPPPGHCERDAELLHEPLERQLPVAELTPLVLRYRSQHRAGPPSTTRRFRASDSASEASTSNTASIRVDDFWACCPPARASARPGTRPRREAGRSA